jgi:alkyl hydroperoxide reductase subunit AhpC
VELAILNEAHALVECVAKTQFSHIRKDHARSDIADPLNRVERFFEVFQEVRKTFGDRRNTKPKLVIFDNCGRALIVIDNKAGITVYVKAVAAAGTLLDELLRVLTQTLHHQERSAADCCAEIGQFSGVCV